MGKITARLAAAEELARNTERASVLERAENSATGDKLAIAARAAKSAGAAELAEIEKKYCSLAAELEARLQKPTTLEDSERDRKDSNKKKKKKRQSKHETHEVSSSDTDWHSDSSSSSIGTSGNHRTSKKKERKRRRKGSKVGFAKMMHKVEAQRAQEAADRREALALSLQKSILKAYYR
jgi:G3E family GTPase